MASPPLLLEPPVFEPTPDPVALPLLELPEEPPEPLLDELPELSPFPLGPAT